VVRRLFGWTAGVMGIAALARTLTRRRADHEPAPAVPPVDDRADALRRKLDESRTAEPEPGPAAETEGSTAERPEPAETIEERRARVHAKAQEAIAAMQEPLE
jgi:hypothetical protein